MFPLALALAAVQAGTSVYGALKGHEKPKEPRYFYKNPNELLPLIRQSVQSGYGGAGEMLREELSSAGLLSSGAYPESLAKLSLARGQEESRATTNFLTQSYGQERGAQLGFENQKYFNDVATNRQSEQDLYSAIGSSAGAVGGYYANIEARKRQDEILDRILGYQSGYNAGGFPNPVPRAEDIPGYPRGPNPRYNALEQRR